jgi:hypothetical protein
MQLTAEVQRLHTAAPVEEVGFVHSDTGMLAAAVAATIIVVQPAQAATAASAAAVAAAIRQTALTHWTDSEDQADLVEVQVEMALLLIQAMAVQAEQTPVVVEVVQGTIQVAITQLAVLAS